MLALELQPSSKGVTKAAEEHFSAQALQFRARRHALLASNIANADTPKFQARDANLADSLTEATAAKGAFAAASVTMTTTAGGHIPSAMAKAQSTIEFGRLRQSEQPTADGNSVDMDIERGEIAKNTILYQFALISLEDEAQEFKAAASDPGSR